MKGEAKQNAYVEEEYIKKEYCAWYSICNWLFIPILQLTRSHPKMRCGGGILWCTFTSFIDHLVISYGEQKRKWVQ